MVVEIMQGRRIDHPEDAAETSDRSAASIVMLGIGNVLLGDDGVGIQLVERLRIESVSGSVRFVDGGTLGFNLLGLIETTDSLLVADAADLDDAPGTVRLFENDEMDRFLASPRRRSVHEVGLCDVLDMARLLDRMPRRRALLCVQPCTIDWTEQLSAPVADTFDVAVAQARSLLHGWCAA